MAQLSEPRIPIYTPTFGREEADALVRCLDPLQFAGGEPIAEFEAAFAGAIGASRAIAVANGTVALHLAMLACSLGPGDEVIVPSLTFIASANAVAYTGATPVLVDVDPISWQMTADEASRHITARTRAILAVHLYGHACDVAGLRALADARGLWLIEDCAEALGTTIGDRHVGLDADVATFSFYKNKTITTGEGGMIITRHAEWHDRIVLLKGQGVPLTRRYWHDVLGYNYRMVNLSAALGNAQIRKLNEILASKRRLAERYKGAMADLPISLQSELSGSRSAWWLIAATAADAPARDGLAAYLESQNIETRPVFLPLQRFPMYAKANVSTPNAERISACGLCLPSSPGMSDEQIDRVVFELKQHFNGL
jgi:perosamine synthetase